MQAIRHFLKSNFCSYKAFPVSLVAHFFYNSSKVGGNGSAFTAAAAAATFLATATAGAVGVAPGEYGSPTCFQFFQLCLTSCQYEKSTSFRVLVTLC